MWYIVSYRWYIIFLTNYLFSLTNTSFYLKYTINHYKVIYKVNDKVNNKMDKMDILDKVGRVKHFYWQFSRIVCLLVNVPQNVQENLLVNNPPINFVEHHLMQDYNH